MNDDTKRFSVDDCCIIKFCNDSRLCAKGLIDLTESLVFKVKRVYYLYDIDPKIERGNHAHRTLDQLVVAMSGKITIEVNDGSRSRKFDLITPCEGLLIPHLIWKRIFFSSRNDLLLVFASEDYNQDDYIRDFMEFLKLVQK